MPLVLAVVVGLVLVWSLLVVALLVGARDRLRVKEALRLLPDIVRLVTRLARDPELPRGVRIRLWLLLAYLASPIDLVPDFIPVVGHADDAVIVMLVLRGVARAAGPAALDRHWPGSPDGRAAVGRLVGS